MLTPTRELCIQVTQALRAYGEREGIEVVAVFGGAPIRDQATRLKEAHVAVGTVGRVIDMIYRHHLFLDDARYVVLDEADEMLDLGFLEDVETILRRAPDGPPDRSLQRHVPAEIRRLAEQFMHDPVEIQVRAATLTIDTVDQFYVEVADREKLEALVDVLKAERPEQAIVFARTKIGVDRLARRLGDAGVRVKALHGDMSQGQRDGVMIAFKCGRERLLVATDVAARGLDITGVSHVVNYDIPNSPDIYVHRIGRTGRAGESGRAITLITPKQRRDLEAIERHAKTEIEEWHPRTATAPERASARERKPSERETRRPRHTKPHQRDGRPLRRSWSSAPGAATGIEPADVVRAVVDNTHLENDDVRNVRVLERFSFVEVPEPSAPARWPRRLREIESGASELRVEVATATMSKATMHTNHGPIEIELFDEDAPKTVENFLKLSRDGYYDGLIFHRVIRDFMIQGGCPQGTGTGGPGYEFEDEINDHKIVRGALAMANRGPDTNGSQFFIVTTEAAPWLDGKHTVFGRVESGMEAVDAIEGAETGARDRPVEDARRSSAMEGRRP